MTDLPSSDLRIPFDIAWLGWAAEGETPPTLEVERTLQVDLTTAIRYAGRRIMRGAGQAADAHGFHVRSAATTRETS